MLPKSVRGQALSSHMGGHEASVTMGGDSEATPSPEGDKAPCPCQGVPGPPLSPPKLS